MYQLIASIWAYVRFFVKVLIEANVNISKKIIFLMFPKCKLHWVTSKDYMSVCWVPGCLRLGLSWFNWWVSFAPEFQCCYFCESSCLFYLSFNFDFYVSKIMHL